MNKYLERTNASKPTFGDYVTLPVKCYGVPNEHFIHEVLSSPFISNSWREVPIDARDPEEHLHDTSETVISVRTQGVNPRDAHVFAVRLADVLPMKGDKWAWQESPLRSRIVELERDKKALRGIEENLREHIDIGTLQLSVATARIAELEAENNRLAELLHNELSSVEIATDLGNKRWVALNDIYENGEKHNANWCKRKAQEGLGIK